MKFEPTSSKRNLHLIFTSLITRIVLTRNMLDYIVLKVYHYLRDVTKAVKYHNEKIVTLINTRRYLECSELLTND